MIRRPLKRRVSFVTTTALLALALLVPSGASAATPALTEIQYGAPEVVAEGELAAVVLGVTNGGKSTVSQLFLDDVVITGGTFLKAYPSQGSCTGAVGGDTVSCAFGQLKPKKSASVIIVVTPTSALVTVTGTFNTTGLGSGDDDASHGDAWDVSADVAVSNDAQDVGGRFIDENGNLIVENSQALSDTNPHSTKVVAPQTLIGVSVQDGPDAAEPTCYLSAADCANLFGDPSVINVAQGGTFAGGFQIIIGFDSSEVVGANQNTLTIYHTYGVGQWEVIDSKCTFAPNSTTPKSLPCLTVTKSGPDLIATIWTIHNGTMKGLS